MRRLWIAVALAVACCATLAVAKLPDTHSLTSAMVANMHIKEIRHHLHRRGDRCHECHSKEDFAATLAGHIDGHIGRGALSAADFKDFKSGIAEQEADELTEQSLRNRASPDGRPVPTDELDAMHSSHMQAKAATMAAHEAADDAEYGVPDMEL
jgi:hypothetical protein